MQRRIHEYTPEGLTDQSYMTVHFKFDGGAHEQIKVIECGMPTESETRYMSEGGVYSILHVWMHNDAHPTEPPFELQPNSQEPGGPLLNEALAPAGHKLKLNAPPTVPLVLREEIALLASKQNATLLTLNDVLAPVSASLNNDPASAGSSAAASSTASAASASAGASGAGSTSSPAVPPTPLCSFRWDVLSALMHLSPLENAAQAEREEKQMAKAMGITGTGEEGKSAEAAAAAAASSSSAASASSSTPAVVASTSASASASSSSTATRRRPLRSSLTAAQGALVSQVLEHYLPAVCQMLVREMSLTLVKETMLRHWTTKTISFTLIEEEELEQQKKREEDTGSKSAVAAASTPGTASASLNALRPQPHTSFSLFLRCCGLRILQSGDLDIYALSSSLGRGVSDLKEMRLADLLDKAQGEALPLSMRSAGRSTGEGKEVAGECRWMKFPSDCALLRFLISALPGCPCNRSSLTA
jgi:hypothetical protein